MSFVPKILRAYATPLLTLIFGAFAFVSGVFLLRSEFDARRNWREVEGTVLGSEVFGTGIRASKRAHNTRVTLRYTIDDVAYVGTTAFLAPMELYYANQKTLEFGTGTRHRIWYRPGDPTEIRLDLDDRFSLFRPFIGTILGLVILVTGVIAWRKIGDKEPQIESA